MGKSRLLDCILICIANWTVVLGSFTKGNRLRKLNYLYSPGGYTIGAKPNWIAVVAPEDMSSVRKIKKKII
jgi:hypothetical protein